MRKSRARTHRPAKNVRKRDDAFGNSLSDKLHGIDEKIRSARERRIESRQTVEEESPVDAPAADALLFRDATAGVRSLERPTTRVAMRPALPTPNGDSPTNQRRIDPTADEHFDIRFSDLYVSGRAAGVSRETVAKLSRGEFAVRSHVDLHGMALDDASDAVDQFLAERQRRGDRCVLVITGKGKNSRGRVAVLRQGIPEWLSRGPSARRVLAFVTARHCDGGEGALYVLLRRDTSRKIRIDVETGGGR